LQFVSVFCTEIAVEEHFYPPKCDFWRGLGGLKKFLGSLSLAIFYAPLVNYAVIRPRDISDGSSVEIVDEFCYVGDMLSENGDADDAVTARIRSGWFKLRSLASFLVAKDVSLLLRGRFVMYAYEMCVTREVRRGH